MELDPDARVRELRRVGPLTRARIFRPLGHGRSDGSRVARRVRIGAGPRRSMMIIIKKERRSAHAEELLVDVGVAAHEREVPQPWRDHATQRHQRWRRVPTFRALQHVSDCDH